MTDLTNIAKDRLLSAQWPSSKTAGRPVRPTPGGSDLELTVGIEAMQKSDKTVFVIGQVIGQIIGGAFKWFFVGLGIATGIKLVWGL